MIEAIYADHDGFHKVIFTVGENIILADRTAASSKKDTRNAVGKSLLLEIIDFCLGSQLSGKKGLKSPALKDWSFTMKITLVDETISVTRRLDDSKSVTIEYLSQNNRQKTLSLQEWQQILGEKLFSLPTSLKEEKYAPTARSLLKHFIRTGKESYIDAFRPVPKQKSYAAQIDNAFLLGLDWRNPQSLQFLKDKDASLSALKKAIKDGVIGADTTSVAKLETELILLSRECEETKNNLDRFEVLPQYRDIEEKANSLTVKISRMNEDNFIDGESLKNYEKSIKEPEDVDNEKLARLFKEAGSILPRNVVKTLDQAKDFHISLIRDRRDFLANTITSLRESISSRKKALEEAVEERAALLSLLKNKRALDEFTVFQEKYTEKLTRKNILEEEISRKKELGRAKQKLKDERDDIEKRTCADRDEKSSLVDEAICLFDDFLRALYKKSGKLIISAGRNGYELSTDIEGASSEGKGKMQIFCYDLTLMILARKRGLGIDFLIHDSTIFDGVDSRQCARALELVAYLSEKYDFQYICTMNTDSVPEQDFSADFNYKSKVRLVLNDKDISESLFGIRF
ncbi:DUF2326 domain-containing protein [Bombella sp. ESL0385]|uniref:DUF2326 domain-containing protein n=1 Tax=Bombella sp. ESL0385 TaxID=2676446 RepID=UPI0012D9E50E|nr:DUF2326 domain-containing protein [Bombella sp. ESL0385]MUG90160.1 DUF2326 domain-containing protein [Bombella sp. ESL0385]